MSAAEGSVGTAAHTSRAEQLRLAGEQWVDAARDSIRHTVDLAAAEARLAVMSGLSMMVMMAVLAAALIVAWGLVVAMAAYLAYRAGVPWLLAGSVLTVAHLLLAYLLWRATLKLSRNLTLPELRDAMLSPGRQPTNL